MNIGIGNDHKGCELKHNLTNYLLNKGYNVIDYGDNNEGNDYPDVAISLGNDIGNKIDMGILICGTGIGMSIACNKVKGIRCAKVSSVEEAILARSHNDSQVIALGSNVLNVNSIVESFLETKFSQEERHIRRINKIKNYE